MDNPTVTRPGELKVWLFCGSKRIEHKRVMIRLRDGRTVTRVQADVRSASGERYFDLQAMPRLEAESPENKCPASKPGRRHAPNRQARGGPALDGRDQETSRLAA